MKNKKNLLNIIDQNNNENSEGITRRDFLKVLGTGAAATTLTACADSTKQKVFPFVQGDETQIPGVAVWYNSTCTECEAGCGIMVRTREGRAVKIEGNKNHPVNRGGLCAIGHSSLQAHYDPDRIRQPLTKSTNDKGENVFKPISWSEAFKKISASLGTKGKKAFITGEVNGTLENLINEFSQELKIDHSVYSPLSQVALAKASELVYGIYGIPEFKFDKADVVLNFGADFLETFVSPCGYAKDWAKSRKSNHPVRVFQVEPRLSLTGANADHWLKCKPGSEGQIALAVLKLLLDKGTGEKLDSATYEQVKDLVQGIDVDKVSNYSGVERGKILSAAQYLFDAKHSLVLAGGASASSEQELSLQVTVGLINLVLGNIGKTINLINSRKPKSDLQRTLEIVSEMEKGDYDVLFVDGSNPLFTLPSNSKFKFAIKKLSLLVSFSSHLDETTKEADLILPSSTSLETWGDNIPYEGVYSLIQPTMTPVFDTKSLGDILLTIAKDSELKTYATFLDYLKDYWKKLQAKIGNSESFEIFWEKSLEQGGQFVSNQNATQIATSPKALKLSFEKVKFDRTRQDKKSKLVLLPYPSIKTFDGRSANRPWMQELPDPVVQAAWDTWAEIHPDTAKANGIKQGDFIQVRNFYGELNVPAYLTPYVHKDVVAVPIGNGHTAYGRYAESVKGGNVYELLPSQKNSSLALLSTNVQIKKGIGKAKLVNVQGSDDQGKREIGKTRDIKTDHGDDHHDDHYGHHGHYEPKQMYEQREHPTYRWGMAVDLAACTGCSACVTACYAENNIPTVGKDIMNQGREMSWLRIERYFDGSADELAVSFVPMMCQHCNNAPCEPVCPVYATYHSEEGLNTMVYNRCVGTRYCGNNCVYKVRRFNWFEFDFPAPLDMQLNPDVMKRTAGVMEKCSFCTQRIAGAKDLAKDEGRMVRDGEVQPACVQSCPTEALVFGDLNDPNSRVSKISKDERSYKILDHHLNTQPVVTYLDNLKYSNKI